MLRLRTLLISIAVIAASIWLWGRVDQRDTTFGESSSAASATIASTATETRSLAEPPSSIAAHDQIAIAAAGDSDNGAAASSAAPSRIASRASLRLDVNAPASAHVGNSLTITIDAEASTAIRDLSFVVVYDDSLLQFVASSPGAFVQQASAPARLGAEDPSTGNVLVHMQINGGVVAGAGTVVVLEFNALQAGIANVTLRDVSVVKSGGAGGDATPAALRAASVVIE